MHDTVRAIRRQAVFIPRYVTTKKTIRIAIGEKLLRITRCVTYRFGRRMGRIIPTACHIPATCQILATRHVLQPPRCP